MSRRYAEGFWSVIDFHRPRSLWAAAGFYLFHLILVILVSLALGALTYTIMQDPTGTKGVDSARTAGAITAAAYVVVIYALLIYLRRGWKNPYYLGGLLVTALLGYLGGGMLGLIPASVTLAIRTKKPSDKAGQ